MKLSSIPTTCMRININIVITCICGGIEYSTWNLRECVSDTANSLAVHSNTAGSSVLAISNDTPLNLEEKEAANLNINLSRFGLSRAYWHIPSLTSVH